VKTSRLLYTGYCWSTEIAGLDNGGLDKDGQILHATS